MASSNPLTRWLRQFEASEAGRIEESHQRAVVSLVKNCESALIGALHGLVLFASKGDQRVGARRAQRRRKHSAGTNNHEHR